MLKGNLLRDCIAQVRQINQSEILGSPLRWPREWGDKIPSMLTGWTSGLLVISGQSNHGKSSVAVSVALALLQANPNLLVLDFTMDDDLRDRLSRYVAILTGLSPDAVKMEYAYKQRLPDNLREKYDETLTRAYTMLSNTDRLFIIDAEVMHRILHGNDGSDGVVVPTIDNILRVIHLIRHQALPPDGQMLVLLDAINDIFIENRNASDNERLATIGSQLMALSQMGGIRIIATSHARKLTNWRRPTMDDVYGASSLKYAAKVITFVYNDYKARRGESQLIYECHPPQPVDWFWKAVIPQSQPMRKSPILCWTFLKNKTSGLDGPTFLQLDPFTAGVTIVPEDEWDYFYAGITQG